MENINAFFFSFVFEKFWFAPAELSSNGLPPGYLHHSHVGQEACLDYSVRGKHTYLYNQLTHFSTHSSCGTQTPLMAVPQSFC